MNIENLFVPIPGYECGYEININGDIYSTLRKVGKFHNAKINSKGGYIQIPLHKNGIRKNHLLHRLVAKTFIPNPENKPEVNHINGDKKNNSVYNLEWITKSENQKHAYKTGLQRRISGENSKSSKFKEYQIIDIKNKIKQGVKIKDLAIEYNVNRATISRINKGITWKGI